MTNELIEKAKECKSADELLALAKENGIEMTAEEAEKRYAQLSGDGEISDEELENTSGGSCNTDAGVLMKTKKLEKGDMFRYFWDASLPERCSNTCDYTVYIVTKVISSSFYSTITYECKCLKCGRVKRMTDSGYTFEKVLTNII